MLQKIDNCSVIQCDICKRIFIYKPTEQKPVPQGWFVDNSKSENRWGTDCEFHLCSKECLEENKKNLN